MSKDFFEALALLEKENGVEASVLIEKISSAITKAIKRDYPDTERISVIIDPENNIFEMALLKTVVEGEPEDSANEINITPAKSYDKRLSVGDICHIPLDKSKFGRVAAQSAKQSIRGDIKEINRAKLIEQFGSKEHECITVTVTKVEPNRGTVNLMYDGTELYLFRNEQIPGETLVEGDIIKVYVVAILNPDRKPIIKISRTHKDLVKRLFELEVPEIYDGTVEIKAISREAGGRTKIAVVSKNANVDAIGACIGPGRSRINAILRELSGEKIDLVGYSDVPEEFIAKALAPAEVLSVTVDDEEAKKCTVVVPNNQLSLAIGNRGQNAKLAARLTGFKIDIKPEFENTIKGIND